MVTGARMPAEDAARSRDILRHGLRRSGRSAGGRARPAARPRGRGPPQSTLGPLTQAMRPNHAATYSKRRHLGAPHAVDFLLNLCFPRSDHAVLAQGPCPSNSLYRSQSNRRPPQSTRKRRPQFVGPPRPCALHNRCRRQTLRERKGRAERRPDHFLTIVLSFPHSQCTAYADCTDFRRNWRPEGHFGPSGAEFDEHRYNQRNAL